MKFLMIKLQAPGGILLRAIAGTYLPATGGTHLSATGGTPRASRAHGIRQVRDIRYYSYEELQHLNGFGVFCMSELRRILDRMGVTIRED